MIETIIEAAQRAGVILTSYFGQQLQLTDKGVSANFCTAADLASEKEIFRIIEMSPLSGYNIISEEFGKIDNKSPYTIIIDPLDGTNNFSLGIPNFSVSIGVIQGEEIIAGVIYIPFLQDTYHAEKGMGAFKNGIPISVNTTASMQNATISYTQGYNEINQKNVFSHLLDLGCKRVLTQRSPAHDYCLLASGKIEGIINNNNDIYDFIAGKLLVQEAGGIIKYIGSEHISNAQFVASNSSLEINNSLYTVFQDHILQ